MRCPAEHDKFLEKLRMTGSGPPYFRIGTRAIRYKVSDLDAYREARMHTKTSEYQPR
jgi:hypothetical protein